MGWRDVFVTSDHEPTVINLFNGNGQPEIPRTYREALPVMRTSNKRCFVQSQYAANLSTTPTQILKFASLTDASATDTLEVGDIVYYVDEMLGKKSDYLRVLKVGIHATDTTEQGYLNSTVNAYNAAHADYYFVVSLPRDPSLGVSSVGAGLYKVKPYYGSAADKKLHVPIHTVNRPCSAHRVVLLGYKLGPKALYPMGYHDVGADDYYILRIAEIDGTLQSNNPIADGALAVLGGDQLGSTTDNFDQKLYASQWSDVGLAQGAINRPINQMTIELTDKYGNPAKVGRLSLWMRIFLNE